ncbi:Phosphohistidine phosphatase SixA [Pseudidiomarina piscicola]|uniref:Phosphohistidine phosphatase SixA n=1 Tax=Pseudidiomarina piscicola TaxID=2614830 RepID=A0A6S6WJG7_9GAMM|nr:phosphohistidine phosphatase SixA [Pseudidiomarina piscicola]CAB0149761.1 Phosphohistidine phosphatase SixA [Pseudidiomarina piscicola]VZT39210.1 Phosphohistidine phosphatase SixA [Pseudomonas aeruginosa]
MSKHVKLYIIRHGEALPAQALQGDAIRPLSQHGEQEVIMSGRWLAQYLGEQGAKQLDWLVVSPYIRARQTASLIERQVNVAEHDVNDGITPDGQAEQVCDWLLAELQQRGSKVEHVAIVSHMPFVSYLVAALDSAMEPILFPTAGIAEMLIEPEQWRGKFVRMAVVEPDQ